MAIPFSYSLRSLWERRATTLATAAGIGLVVFVLASTFMLATGLQKTLLDAGSRDKAIVLQRDGYSESGSRLKQAAFTWVTAAPGIVSDAGGAQKVVGESVVHVYRSKPGDDTRQASVQIRGVTPASYALRPEVRIIEGRAAAPGTNEAIVGRALHGDYEGVLLGSGFDLQKNRPISIVGVFESGGSAYESEVWADLDTVRSSFGAMGYLSSVTAQLTSEAAFDGFKLALEEDDKRGLEVLRETEYYERVSNNLSRVITGIGTLVTAIFSLGALLGAMITMYAAVAQRQKEIGVMRALGFQRRHVLGSILLESFAVATAGGVLGLGLSLLTPLVEVSAVNWATAQELAFRFVPTSAVLGGALLAGVTVGLVGGLLPAIRAARVDPVSAMRA